MEKEVIDDLSCSSEKSSASPEQTNLNSSLVSKNTEDDGEVCVKSDSESNNTETLAEPHISADHRSSSDEEDLNIFKHKLSLTREQNTSEDEGDENYYRRLKKRKENFMESDSDSNNAVTNLEPVISDDPKLPKNEDHKTVKHKSLLLSRKHNKSDDGDTDNDEECIKSSMKQKKSLVDSDSDSNISRTSPKPVNSESGSDDNDLRIFKHKKSHSRIRKNSSSDESALSEANNQVLPEDSAQEIPEHEIRIKNKTKNLKQKFKSLVSSRSKPKGSESNKSSKSINTSDSEHSNSSNTAQDDLTSIEKIKQKIKERSETLKSTIYDPDTSDDERAHQQEHRRPKQKSRSKKADSPKPVRMSAKQAMENMQKIKSESNRMLREKEVSLPYHRPKALSLKDIMSRRKPALSADGKTLPLKMNDEQLRQYAKQLEKRQKEIVELCKSDTEEEEEDTETTQEKREDIDSKTPSELDKIDDFSVAGTNNKSIEQTNNQAQDTNISSDELFDRPIAESRVENSIHNEKTSNIIQVNAVIHTDIDENNQTTENCKPNTETESQLISLHYDSEKIDTVAENTINASEILINDEEVDESLALDKQPIPATPNIQDECENIIENIATSNPDCSKESNEAVSINQKETVKVLSSIEENSHEVKVVERNIPTENENSIEGFSDDDAMDMDDIDQLIENADLIESSTNTTYLDSPMLIKDSYPTTKPKLTGTPGMVIDLDGSDLRGPNKLSGIQLLKERFNYFAKLKTPEELERQTKNKIKPGTQHLKLKQELENQIAEQRSLEWAKRLEEEKQQQKELNALRGEDSDVDEDDIEKLEAKLETREVEKVSEAETESEPEENDVVLEDKPKKHHPLVDEEAEESDCDDDDNNGDNDTRDIENEDQDGDGESSDDESTESESDDENVTKLLKKGRILKAFEDSDDEESDKTEAREPVDSVNSDLSVTKKKDNGLCDINTSQDEDIQLAQMQKSVSDDVFATQESENKTEDSGKIPDTNIEPNSSGNYESLTINFDKVPVICETQPYDEDQFDEIAGMCSGSFTQNINTLPLTNDTQKTPEIGDDIAAMCTGNFVDNHFLSQDKELEKESQYPPVNEHSDRLNDSGTNDIESSYISKDPHENTAINKPENMTEGDDINEETVVDKPIDDNLKSILDELHDPEFDSPKPYKFFTDGQENKAVNVNNQMKKKFTIDSDDEEAEKSVENYKIGKKTKRKKLQDRALQISDDEEDISSAEENEEEGLESDIEENEGESAERIVEYDSEENEVEINEPTKKMKRKATDFFEQEAELSSEDEWAGSGDEDEAGLDRMEREAGDDDTFHQGKLRRELGKIHMRDVLDQDKREVRLLQELLLEDGDLGGGHRQRKFRWKNADDVEEGGTFGDSFLDTPEEQAESEEQWRKQRHERELFLRQMMQKENESDYSLNITSSTIIKASLTPDAVSSSILEVKTLEVDSPVERKTVKDIPSPAKKPFMLMQQSYRGSLLARGSNTLGRLAAIATPIAGDGDDHTPKTSSLGPSSKRNFVFAAVSPSSEEKPKVTKRKAEPTGTPNLMKKMKTDEKRRLTKCSLLDHMKA